MSRKSAKPLTSLLRPRPPGEAAVETDRADEQADDAPIRQRDREDDHEMVNAAIDLCRAHREYCQATLGMAYVPWMRLDEAIEQVQRGVRAEDLPTLVALRAMV